MMLVKLEEQTELSGSQQPEKRGRAQNRQSSITKLLIDRRTLPFHRKKRVGCDIREDTTKHPVGIVLGMPRKAMGDKRTVLVVSVDRI